MICFFCFVLLNCILPHDLFHCSLEFNSEYKLDSAYSRVPMSEVGREQDDEEEFLENLSDDDEDEEQALEGELDDDMSFASAPSEASDKAEINVRHAMTI